MNRFFCENRIEEIERELILINKCCEKATHRNILDYRLEKQIELINLKIKLEGIKAGLKID
jgi:hypothetical protein